MKMRDHDWLFELKDKLYHFINEMAEQDFQFVRYSYSGDLFPPEKHWGLGNLVFASKVLYISDLLKRLETQKIDNLIKGIKKFRQGYYYSDPVLFERDWRNVLKHIKNPQKKKQKKTPIMRAETRQTFAALYLLGSKPEFPYKEIPDEGKNIIRYLQALDWTHPWHAGSHFSHLLFFLTMNAYFFPEQSTRKAVDSAVYWLNSLQSPRGGTWYKADDVSLKEKINGSMKVITGLHAAGIYKFPYARQLIDTALTGTNDDEACSHFNIAYVLYGCLFNEPDYRRDEIHSFLYRRLKLYKHHYYTAYGGFSFKLNQANEFYYGKKVTKGLNEPDIHGTALFVWGIAVINKVLDLGLDFKIPIN